MKTRKIILGTLAVSCLLNTNYISSAVAQSSNEWLKETLGVYPSQIWGAGRLMSGTTEFQEMSDGSLGGNYTMNELREVVPGTLSQCQAIQLLVMRCIWNDRYGTGNLEVTFSENFSSFVGYWGDDRSEPSFRWSGER